ncbi:PREDICTED: uncharacterized protein LOC109127011 [Camelina sativa]|uniref:Uncharacterized protein LOC109127011 n=1 Tax=Camelina sativa TaxID=90675 RepID=A0ABM1QIM1_CAMSA|nr:PREDICTED: uncharacterized protein LOC109127011 [Camelina sativa]
MATKTSQLVSLFFSLLLLLLFVSSQVGFTQAQSDQPTSSPSRPIPPPPPRFYVPPSKSRRGKGT